jgi:hypothetical protein
MNTAATPIANLNECAPSIVFGDSEPKQLQGCFWCLSMNSPNPIIAKQNNAQSPFVHGVQGRKKEMAITTSNIAIYLFEKIEIRLTLIGGECCI